MIFSFKDKKPLQFFVKEQLSEKRSLTPEGFLLIQEVPLARTGSMKYTTGEVPVEAGPDGAVTIDREEKEVFRPETMASFNGKPVVNEHPDEDVTPDNWAYLACGVIMNPRRGEGEYRDCMVADLLITRRSMIADIDAGKIEVSCGYDAEYEETGRGTGRQFNIVGNHVALVDKGRCGPRCAIGDSAPSSQQEKQMRKKFKLKDWLIRAMKAKDAEELEKVATDAEAELEKHVDAAEPDPVHVHLHGQGGQQDDGEEGTPMTDEEIRGAFQRMDEAHQAMKSQLDEAMEYIGAAKQKAADEAAAAEKAAAATDSVENEILDEVPGSTKDSASKTQDSIGLEASFMDTVAGAEILAPGIRVPQFKKGDAPAKTLDTMFALRKTALDLAHGQADMRGLLTDLNGGKELSLSTMTRDSVRTIFRAAVGAKKTLNNVALMSGGRSSVTTRAHDGKKSAPTSLADLNKRNREHYGIK